MSDALVALARELWEAHATHSQQVIPFPQRHWNELDPFTQDHWFHVARTAMAFRPASTAAVADAGRHALQARAAELLGTVLAHADLAGLRGRTTLATLALPGELLDEAFAVAAALGRTNG